MTVEERENVVFLETTWKHALKVSWSILWMFSLFGFIASAGTGIVLRLVLGLAGISPDTAKSLSDFAGAVTGIAVFIPVVKVVLKKTFSDFRIVLVRTK